MPCLFPLITDHHWLWIYTFCFVFAAALDKASPSTFCLSQQPSLHIQPQRVCIYGVNCTTGPCTAAFLLHPLGTAQDQRQLPINGVLETWGDFCSSPKAGAKLLACPANINLQPSLSA